MPNGLGIILVKISSFFSLLLQIFSFSLYLVSHSVLFFYIQTICVIILKPSPEHGRKPAVWAWFNHAFEKTACNYALRCCRKA